MEKVQFENSDIITFHQYSTADALESCLTNADLVIGAVLVPGAAAPKSSKLWRCEPGSSEFSVRVKVVSMA